MRNRRLGVVLLVFVGIAVLLSARLIDVQMIQGPTLSALAQSERTRQVVVVPTRGSIYDREGRLLAVDSVTPSIEADPLQITAPRAEAAVLAPILKMSAAKITSLLSEKTGFVWVKHSVTSSVAAQVMQLALPGIGEQKERRRLYPMGDLAGQVLGFVGVDGQGLAGVEESYNSVLAGQPGLDVEQTDAFGDPLPQTIKVLKRPKPGESIQLTLDATLQAFAQRELAATVKKAHAPSGRIVMMDPQTGAILAMAQWPFVNPNHYGSYSAKDWEDTPVEAAYPPGSTFKPITAAAALTDKLITPQSMFWDPGYKVVTGHMFHGWEWPNSFGWLNFDHAVALSSDIAFIDIGLKLGAQRFMNYMRHIDLLSSLHVDLPGESSGVWLPEQNIRPVDLSVMAFGQTETLTALQMVTAISAVANGGRMMWPHVGKAVIGPNGHVHPIKPRMLVRAMSPKVSAEIRQAMADVVKFGTGTSAQIPGYTLAGKTGTSQVLANGQYVSGLYMSSFVGYGPLPDPKLLILVQIDHPKGAFYGAEVAAPAFKVVMQESLSYLGIPPNTPVHPKADASLISSWVGQSLAHAARLATAQHLVVKVEGRGARVVSQTPSQGSFAPGSVVTLIAGGKGDSAMPNLTGLSMPTATAVLNAEGLHIVPQGAGVVLSQSPAAGRPLPKNGRIKVIFGP